jgi:hypothetical protein
VRLDKDDREPCGIPQPFPGHSGRRFDPSQFMVFPTMDPSATACVVAQVGHAPTEEGGTVMLPRCHDLNGENAGPSGHGGAVDSQRAGASAAAGAAAGVSHLTAAQRQAFSWQAARAVGWGKSSAKKWFLTWVMNPSSTLSTFLGADNDNDDGDDDDEDLISRR